MDGDKVLVLHRPSRDEVRLPKGHIKKGESRAEAALREVTEESGYAGLEVVGYLGHQVVEYDYQDVHIVRDEYYYLMRLRSRDQVDQEAQFKSDWVRWDRALVDLTYRVEREWVRRAREIGQDEGGAGD